jgi:hypothetical protein
MAYVESCTITFRHREDGMYRVEARAYIWVNGERKLSVCVSEPNALEHSHTIGQDLDQLFQIVRWQITDSVIRDRLTDAPRLDG